MKDIGHSIDTRAVAPGRRRLLAFLGPAALVSVGYMDPGNWATDLQGGAAFGYQLVWVLLLSNFIAMLLQTLAARLGVAGGVDLAQACRAYYPRAAMLALWVLCEIAIVATDLAEVLGSAVALNLLFGLPLLWGALVTGFDVLLILLLQHRGMRKLEALITVMVLTIGGCFALEIALAHPDWRGVAAGFVPHIDAQSLYVAIGILGATVMPHNLYLHSSLVQTRRIGEGTHFVREALRYNLVDTVLLLSVALFINTAILVLSAAVFHHGGIQVTDLRQAHALLAPILGTSLAPMAFAIALLVAGQSSTITGTMATLAAVIAVAAFASAPLLAWISFGRLRQPPTARVKP